MSASLWDADAPMPRDPESPMDAIPPQDLDAEQATLGAMLLGGSAASNLLGQLQPEDFYRDSHAEIARACLRLAADGQPVDSVTVGLALRQAGRLEAVGGLDYLDRLVQTTPYTANAISYARQVVTCARRRQMLDGARRLAREAADDEADLPSLLVSAQALVDDVRPVGADTAVASTELWGRWLAHSRADHHPITTGFAALDAEMGGGWHRSQCHVLTAKYGKGKTSLVCHFAVAALQAGRRVGIVSREMESWEMMARLGAIVADVPYRDLEWGLPAYGREWRGRCVRTAIEEAINLPLWEGLAIDDDPDGDLATVLARMSAMRREHGSELIIIDHAGLVTTPTAANDYEQNLSVSQAMHRAARRLGCPVLMVAQQRIQRGQGASDEAIKGGSRWAENAPLVLVLSPDFTEATPTARLEAAKVRGGTPLTDHRAIELVGDYHTMRWVVAEPARQEAAPPRQYRDDDPYEEAE